MHLLIVVLVVVMVNLGFWQLRRLHERRDDNAVVRARTAETPVAVDSVATPTTSGDALDALRYRAVTATGAYATGATTVVSGRTQEGGPGGWVVTPMTVGADTVLVLRGFARLGADGAVPTPRPPGGTVAVRGYALAINGFDNIARHDLDDLRAAHPGTLPVVVQATASDPADDATMAPIPLPELTDGPHLSYAVQWFLFSTIAVVGYPFALRRAAGKREGEAGPTATPPPGS